MSEGLTSPEMLRTLMDVLAGDAQHVDKIAALLPDEYQYAARIVIQHQQTYNVPALREERHCPDILDADDYAQEMALAILRALDTYDECRGTTFTTWVMREIRYRVRDLHRRTFPYTAQEVANLLISELEVVQYEEQPEGRYPEPYGPDEALELSEAVVDFTRFVHELSDRDQAILYMRMHEHASQKEIACVLHISQKAVSSRMSKIRIAYERFREEEISSGRTKRFSPVVGVSQEAVCTAHT